MPKTKTPKTAQADWKKLLSTLRGETRPMLACLKQAVELESPTNSKPHVDRVAKFFARQIRRAGGSARLLPHRVAGEALLGEFWGRLPGRPLLLLGHLDTVWDVGTLGRMPFRVRGGRAYGPGIFDMKAGVVMGLWAVRALRALGLTPPRPVRFLLNSDEETSTFAFRKLIESEGRKACAVLVAEPALGPALKTARKGVGEFRLTVHGRSAHAGVNPAAGVNAIAELARQLLHVERFARPRRGLTLNVGVVEGGTRTNVVPEIATAVIDVRVPRAQDGPWIERRMRSLKPVDRRARLEIEGGVRRPPLERKMAKDLFRRAREVGRKLGMELTEASTGGGSDGNFTAALGIPTLDGLGAVGDGAHALHEHIVIAELPRRAALLAALMMTL